MSVMVLLAPYHATAFQPRASSQRGRFRDRLYLEKGSNNSRSKQAELAKKMKAAKQQQQAEEMFSSTAAETQVGEEEIRVLRERLLFAQLLDKNLPPPIQSERQFSKTEFAPLPSPATNTGPKVRAKDLKRLKKESVATTKTNCTLLLM
jgi:hypothetical protein